MDLAARDVFFYTTFGGEALSLAAAKATIQELKRTRATEHIALQGQKLREGYNELANRLEVDFSRCVGLDYRTMIAFDSAKGDPAREKSLMQQELVKRGCCGTDFTTSRYRMTMGNRSSARRLPRSASHPAQSGTRGAPARISAR